MALDSKNSRNCWRISALFIVVSSVMTVRGGGKQSVDFTIKTRPAALLPARGGFGRASRSVLQRWRRSFLPSWL